MRKKRIISDSSSSSSEESDDGKEAKEEKSDDEKDSKKWRKIKMEVKSKTCEEETKTADDAKENTEAINIKAEPVPEPEPQPVLDKSTEPTKEPTPEPKSTGVEATKGLKVLTKRGTRKRKKPQSEATKSYRRRLKAKEQRLMKTLNEETTESEPKPKPKHKRKPTELDKLHEDIRSMFICEGVVTATGQRTCRLLKENGGSICNIDMFKECAKVIEEKFQRKSRTPNKNDNQNNEDSRSRSQSVETEASRDRSVSRNRNHSPEESNENIESLVVRQLRISKPVVVLQRADIDKLGYAYKIADCPKSLRRRHGRNVAKCSGGRINLPIPKNIVKQEPIKKEIVKKEVVKKEPDEIPNKTYLERNLRKSIRLKECPSLKRGFNPKPLEEIIAKLTEKTGELKEVSVTVNKFSEKLKGTRKKKFVMMNKDNKKEKKQKAEEVKVDKLKKDLSDHAFDKNLAVDAEYPCLLCSVRCKNISSHYRISHPGSEVLISRLSKEEAEKAIADSNENNYNVSGLDKASTLDAIKRRVKSKLNEKGFFCRMCSIGMVPTSELFFAHVSVHTGEFRFKCPSEKCVTMLPDLDSLRAHIFRSHPSGKQNLLSKAVELFPLPTEYDNLYGYLCSKCYFVQTMRRNVEHHVAVFHGSDTDVDIIKIDMSGKSEKQVSALPKEPEKRTVKKPRSKTTNKNVETQNSEVNESSEEVEGRRITRSRPAEEKQFKPRVETTTDTTTSGEINSEKRVKKKRKTEVDILLEMQKKDTESEESENSSEGILDSLDTNSLEMETDSESKSSEVAVFSEHVNEYVKNLKNTKPGTKNQSEKKTDADENREDDDGSIFQATATFLDSSGDSSTVKEGNDQAQKEGLPPKLRKVLKGSADSAEHCREVKVGPLGATSLVNDDIEYECFVKGCVFSNGACDLFEKHITIAHTKTKWDGMCQTCGIYVESQTPSGGVRSFKLTSALEHLKNCHEKVQEVKSTKEKVKDEDSKEDILKKIKTEPGNQEVSKGKIKTDVDDKPDSNSADKLKVETKVKIETTEDVAPFPVKPLLRVRTFFGDRLSTPKSEMSPTPDGSQLTENPVITVDEEDDESEPALFTIENVMSLNPEAGGSETNQDKISEILPLTPQKSVIINNAGSALPPLRTIASSANIAVNKPLLLRQVPSPKFTVRSATPKNQIAIAPKQIPNKQIPFKVVPVSSIGSPVVLTQFGSSNSIRLIPSSAVSMQPVMISQCKPMNVTAKIVPIVNPTTSATQPKISTEAQASSILRDNPLLTQTVMGNKPSFDALRCVTTISSPVTTPIQIKSPNRMTPPTTLNPSTSVSSDGNNEDASSYRRPHHNSQGGKNVKDAKIYQEMLTKPKLCQLFKCMAVECSFTCSNEGVFTQHIGLHEAHQKMQNQKMNIKSKKVYNWQQCAYCCEVIVQSGAALSQHILSEHGHCLYQCAYCFYRAVSQTYVELHQNYVHPDVLKQRPRVILKCKPIPNLPASKTSSQKQTRRQSVRPYLCVQCNSRFFITQEFMDHLAKEHQSVTAYTCHICKNLCFKADRLIAHYKLHSYGTFQCAYCLHAAETKKEMLFHLCNCHFSQPAYMYVRALAQGQRGNHLEALEVVSYENDSPNSEHIIEADTEDIEGVDGSAQKSASLDLTAIVTELGIDVTEESETTVTPVMRELMSLDTRRAVSVETLLPNAQFSSEEENSTVNKDDSSSVPIGQLPLEALGVKESAAAAATATKIVPPQSKESTEVDKTLKLNEIIINLSKDKSITIVEKPSEEVPVVKSGIHRMPPTVSPTKFSVKNVYPAKGVSKKADIGSELKKAQTILYQRLSAGDKSDSEEKNSSGKSTPSKIINITSPRESVEKEQDQPIGVITSVVSMCENEGFPQISEVRSLSQEENEESSNKIVINIQSKKLEVPQLQPPIIRVEDFQVNQNTESTSEGNSDKNREKKPEKPESPEIIILDDEPEENTNTSNQSFEEKESGKRTRNSRSVLKKLKIEKDPPSDDKIREEMERLRDQMQNETDCWLFDDDDTSQKSTGKKNDKTPELLSPIEEAIFSLNKKLESEKDDNNSKDKESDEVITVSDDKECNEDSEKSADKAEDVSLNSCKDKNQNKSKDKGTEEKNVKNTDIELYGKDLYLCGVGTCNFAAETDTELKDHLYVCDHSRESSIITCRHCCKRLKQTVPYVEHLKLHGEKKFKCGVCDFSSGLESGVVRHLKLKHKVNHSRSVPSEPISKGYFTVFPKNHKTETAKDLEMTGYSPGDEDKLPLQAVYLRNVKCAMCPYYTKVRSNMVRHLKIHLKSAETEGTVIVPSTAPTNPVPCLDTKEKMFDKMTNLAASSQLAQAKEKSAIEMLSPEEEAKLPQFVPDYSRYKCCSPDCPYITVDDSMLRNHIKTLHDEITFYSCPHCEETVSLDLRLVALEKVGNHLKYHDSKLYKCAHCPYFHHQKHIVEKHVIERHPDKKYYVHTVREPKIESASEEEFNIPDTAVGKAWQCGLCNEFESTIRSVVQNHLLTVHNSKSKYKCKLCDLKSSHPQYFGNHFSSKHPGEKVAYIKSIVKVNATPEAPSTSQAPEPTSEHFDTTPIWKRDAPRIRHIRGILIEEEEVKTRKSKKQNDEEEDKDSNQSPSITVLDCYFCPLCNEKEDKKKTFQTKSADAFRSHLYAELNYNQFACILCGKMFVDKKEFSKHHVKSHPDKAESFSQTKEDPDITFWVEKVISKQRADIERKRRSSTEEASTPTKKKKPSTPEKAPRSVLKRNLGKLSASSSSESDVGKEYEKEFICRNCQIKTIDLTSLKSHIKVSHLKLGRFLCTFCESTFQTETLAQKHCRNKHPDNEFKIIPNPDKTELNDEFWKRQYGFENGKIIKNFVPKNVVRCRFCNFRDIPHLVIGHEKQHLEAVQFKCGHCTYKAKVREDMINHISESHPGAKCLFSESSNAMSSKLNQKLEEKDKLNVVYSCGHCSTESNFENIVIDHLEKKHKTSEDGEIRKRNTEQIFYCCNNCVFRAMDVESLTKHGQSAHGQSAVGYKKIKLVEYELIDDIEQCVTCQKADCVCGVQYTADNAPNGYHNCPQCDFICPTYDECLDHFEQHYFKFGCTVCAAKFVTEVEFQEHQKLTRHPANFKVLEPEESALEEYKRLILTKRNGKWGTTNRKRPKEFEEPASKGVKKHKMKSGVGGGIN